MKICESVSLKGLTTLKIGGVAHYFCRVRNEHELQTALQFSKKKEVPLIILGGGSNVLLSDGSISALVAKIDIKGILLEELFREEFFARSGLFLEGISVFSSRPFAEKIGFSAYSLFIYSLKDKTHSQKVQFNYLLRGRDKKGILEMMEGKFVSPGTVMISPAHSVEFGEILQRNRVQHKKMDILVHL